MPTQEQLQELVAAAAELTDYLAGWSKRDDEVATDVDLQSRAQALSDALRPFGQ